MRSPTTTLNDWGRASTAGSSEHRRADLASPADPADPSCPVRPCRLVAQPWPRKPGRQRSRGNGQRLHRREPSLRPDDRCGSTQPRLDRSRRPQAASNQKGACDLAATDLPRVSSPTAAEAVVHPAISHHRPHAAEPYYHSGLGSPRALIPPCARLTRDLRPTTTTRPSPRSHHEWPGPCSTPNQLQQGRQDLSLSRRSQKAGTRRPSPQHQGEAPASPGRNSRS